MNIQEFIENFADQPDATEVADLNADTNFRELDDWSSLSALAVLGMIDDEYDVQLKGNEMRGANTIQELFDLVSSKLA